jgi:CDP-paratose synthetase
MDIFISGASGYLGRHLVKSLSKKHRVFALVRSTSLIGITAVPVENYIYIDDVSALEDAFSKNNPDVVINTAALYGRKGESTLALVDANIEYPTRLLTLANKYNCKAFIQTGTSLPDDISLYALTKNTFVKLARLQTGTLKFINIELEHFYGPNDDVSKFISYVINQCINGNDLSLTEGLQKRDFIYIDDVVSAYSIIIKNLGDFKQFETVPVGSGLSPTIKESVEIIHTLIKSSSKLKFGAVSMRENELMYSCADTSKLVNLGWNLRYSIEAGIKATVKGTKV